jgi:RNA polymerase sigma-70 factor (ECF subfamily)
MFFVTSGIEIDRFGNEMNNTEQIWKEYYYRLLNFIKSRVRDASSADDILQEVFARVHSRIDTLREDSKIQSWIYQITRNAIIDHYRAQKITQELPESLSNAEMDQGDNTPYEIAGWLLPMIQKMPEHYRQAIMLSEIEGLTQKEVAGRLGISLPGAKSRIQRARSMVKKMLLDCCRFEFDRRGTVIDYEVNGRRCDQC